MHNSLMTVANSWKKCQVPTHNPLKERSHCHNMALLGDEECTVRWALCMHARVNKCDNRTASKTNTCVPTGPSMNSPFHDLCRFCNPSRACSTAASLRTVRSIACETSAVGCPAWTGVLAPTALGGPVSAQSRASLASSRRHSLW